jgi:hypothetical protein
MAITVPAMTKAIQVAKDMGKFGETEEREGEWRAACRGATE